VADGLREHGLGNVVLDPVMVATSGDRLLDTGGETVVLEELLPLCTLVTPNLPEVARLTGVDVDDATSQRRAAEALLRLGPAWVLVKGGHLAGDAVDLLTDGDTSLELRAPRLDNRHTHGTGCTLASAIASFLARGDDPVTAVRQAKDYVTEAIRGGFPLGAFAMTDAVAGRLEAGDHGGTYCGNPLACAVADAEAVDAGPDLVDAMLAVFEEVTPAMNLCMQIELG